MKSDRSFRSSSNKAAFRDGDSRNGVHNRNGDTGRAIYFANEAVTISINNTRNRNPESEAVLNADAPVDKGVAHPR